MKTDWRGWIYRIAIVLAVILSIAAFLPLWQTDRWWVRMLDYPRLQLAGIGVVILLLLIAGSQDYRRRHFGLVVSALSIATLWQLLHTVRYLPFAPESVKSAEQCPADKRLSVLNANVLLGNDDYSAVLAMVERRDPDIVVLLESGISWEAAMRPLHDEYGYRLGEPVPNAYGLLLYSKLPFEGEVQMRVAEGVPSVTGTLTLRDGSRVRIDAVHPEPPWPGDDVGERDAELVLVGREIREDGRASLIVGDLNDVAWSKTSRLFLDVAGMEDPREGRGLIPTFNAKWPLMRWPLDHLFVSPHWELIDLAREDDIGSDHFPLFVDLCLAKPADRRMVDPRADSETTEDATEQLQDGADEVREQR